MTAPLKVLAGTKFSFLLFSNQIMNQINAKSARIIIIRRPSKFKFILYELHWETLRSREIMDLVACICVFVGLSPPIWTDWHLTLIFVIRVDLDLEEAGIVGQGRRSKFKVKCLNKKITADRPHPHDYSQTPADYRDRNIKRKGSIFPLNLNALIDLRAEASKKGVFFPITH